MTRTKALESAERCFRSAEVANRKVAHNADWREAYAEEAKAYAQIGMGYLELAKELRLGA